MLINAATKTTTSPPIFISTRRTKNRDFNRSATSI
jgi:hypothetical protein